MAKDRSTEADASHQAYAKGYLFHTVRQGRAPANYERIPNWLGFPRNLSTITRSMSGNAGGLNGSTQHLRRTRLALKTKTKSLAGVRSAGTLTWLGFDPGQPIGSLLPGEALSMYWMVLHRPVELARPIGT